MNITDASKKDVRLSLSDYDDMVDNILDDRIDDHMMLKFKKLSYFMASGRTIVGKECSNCQAS